jgi:hypothetical protein
MDIVFVKLRRTWVWQYLVDPAPNHDVSAKKDANNLVIGGWVGEIGDG